MENESDHAGPEKIKRIKKALADGSYYVSSAEIVRAMVDQKKNMNETGKAE